jgi:hypothetical protein
VEITDGNIYAAPQSSGRKTSQRERPVIRCTRDHNIKMDCKTKGWNFVLDLCGSCEHGNDIF